VSGGSGDDDIKRNNAASEPVRHRDTLRMEVVADRSNNSPLGSAGGSTQSRSLIHVVGRNRHTGSNWRGRLGFIDNPDVGPRGYNIVLNRIRLHNIVQTIRIKRKQGKARQGRRGGSGEGRKMKKEEKKKEKGEGGPNGRESTKPKRIRRR
jgi:hypothetical protein